MARRKMKQDRKVVGDIVMVKLRDFEPNGWNANKMTARQYESLCLGLKTDGWLKSHALTVWGTNEKGEVMNLIIDGEHRHRGALATGFTEGPALVVNGITELEARELNAKLDNKGDRDPDKLAALILSIRDAASSARNQIKASDTIAQRIGLSDAQYSRLMRPHDEDAPPKTPKPPSQSEKVAMVKLFFEKEDHAEFIRLVEELGDLYDTTNASDTVLHALKKLT